MSTWRPVLDGAERDAALAVVREIGAALAEGPPGPGHGPGLARGDAGISLFYAYAHRADERAGWDERARASLDAAIDALAERPLDASLYDGFTGVAWAAGHLDDRSEPGGDDAHAQVDEALALHLSISPWPGDYDLIVGLVGMGLYAVDRLSTGSESAAARTCAVRVVDRLEEMAEETREGLTWHTPGRLLIPEMRERYPGGYYDLGVAHGVPAVLTLMALLRAREIEPARTGRMLERGLAWLRRHANPAREASRFAYHVADLVEDRASRVAWCYGDLGIAAALLWAARAGGGGEVERALEEEALRAAGKASARRPDDCGVNDAGLCHGAAGLALLYARLYNATTDERFRERARLWYGKTLDRRSPGAGVAGYTEEHGLLTGAAGIGLGLLAGASEVEPGWDRMLLTSVPPL